MTLSMLDATASPFKFCKSVMEALGNEKAPEELDELLILEALAAHTGMAIHPALQGLDQRKVNHTKVAEINSMKSLVSAIIEGTY
jgi:threonine synthase